MVEIRCTTVVADGGRQEGGAAGGTLYTLRATTTRYKWLSDPRHRRMMEAAVASWRVR